MRKKPVQLIVFSIIFGGLLNLVSRVSFLRENKIIALLVVLVLFTISILSTYYASTKYLNKYFKR